MLLGGAPIEVASAGIPGTSGRAMDSEMATQLERRGGDSAGHVSRAVDAGLLSWADVVLTFEFAHDLQIAETWQSAAPRTFGLGQFAEAVTKFDAGAGRGSELAARARKMTGANSLGWDVDDPYGRGRRAATAAAAQIDKALEGVLRGLLGLPAAMAGPRRAAPAAKFRLRP